MRITHSLNTMLLAVAVGGTGVCASGQSVFPEQQAVLQKNNLNLKAQGAECAATQADNKTGLNLADPEVEVSYMFGQPSDVPNKTNISVTQSFDFATLSGAKRRVAEADNTVVGAQLEVERQAFALTAENALINYVYQVKLCAELEKQLATLRQLQTHAGKGLAKGAITQLDYNKMELSVLTLENSLAEARQEAEALRMELYALNGGSPFGLPETWPAAGLPDSFDTWLKQTEQSNAELRLLQSGIVRSTREVELRKKEGLPEFSVGYTNELVKNSNYHGFAIGFSLPLWSNAGRVKSARGAQTAARLRAESLTEEYAARKRTEYERARMLAETMRRYAEFGKRIDSQNRAHLQKAYDAGTITVLDYLQEQESFFEYAVSSLAAERDYQLARAALYAPTF